MRNTILASSALLTGSSSALPEGRLFALDFQTLIGIIIQVINIVGLFVILYFILYKPVKNLLAKRTKHFEGMLGEVEERESKADNLIDEYKEKLSGVEDERKRLVAEARAEAEEEKKRIMLKAQNEADKLKEDARQSLETERKLLQRNTKDYVIELSMLLAEKSLKDSVDPEAQEKQFEESLKELEASSWKN